jgi:RNA polymerase sigma-70 factor (ECF subfamily)
MTTLAASSPEVSQLLEDWSDGNQAALEQLMPLVYHELRRLARRYLNKERVGHTLQTTELVHEAYVRLVDQRRVHWQNRAHFFGVAAQLMRRILVDRARHRKRAKRGGEAMMVSLEQAALVRNRTTVDLLALDEALSKLC